MAVILTSFLPRIFFALFIAFSISFAVGKRYLFHFMTHFLFVKFIKSGIAISWIIIPGSESIKAPDINSAKVNVFPTIPINIHFVSPYIILPAIIADMSEMYIRAILAIFSRL